MFGKLLKNDLKAQYHSMSAIFFGIFIISLSAEIVALFSKTDLGKVLGGLVVMAALLFACFFILIAVGLMFSKTMYGRAGYLTLTLPVKTSKLIWSKTLSGLIWTFAVYFLFVGSCVLWFFQVKDLVGQEALESAETLLKLFGAPSFKMLAVILIFFAVSLGITMLLITQSIYLGITVSNVKPFSKLGVIGALIVSFACFLIIQSISSSVDELLPIGMVVSSKAITFTSNTVQALHNAGAQAVSISFMGPIFRLIVGILLHFPISFLAEKKVNVQ